MTVTVADRTRTTGGPSRGLLIVAAAGYGKTTSLEGVCDRGPNGYLSARDLAVADPVRWIQLADSVATAPLKRVVVDDFDTLSKAEQARIARALGALPDRVQVSIGCREPVDAEVIAALRRPLICRGPADLALSTDQIAVVLRTEHDRDELEIASSVSSLTAGWPMLVQLAGSSLSHGAGRAELSWALADPGTAGALWIQEQVLASLPADARRLLDLAVGLDPISLPLLLAVADANQGWTDRHRIACAYEWLTAIGVLVPPEQDVRDGTGRLVPAVGHVLARSSPSWTGLTAARRDATEQRSRRSFGAAAEWYAANRHHLAAAVSLVRAGEAGESAALIESGGAEMIAAGGAAAVIELIEGLPAGERDRPGIQLNYADALRSVGEVGRAAGVFDGLLSGSDAASGLPPGLAWRLGMLHYLRADFTRAVAECARVEAAPESVPVGPSDDVDAVLTDVCWSSSLAMLGETERSAALAARALRRAVLSGNDRALAAAHLAKALTGRGHRLEEHLTEAAAAAERGADVVAQARILTNLVDSLFRQARYPQALDLARRAVRAAELGSPPGLLATVLCNAGEVLMQMGRFGEAALHFERAVRTARRAGPNRTALGLWGVAEVHRRCGRREQARAVFEEAVDLARGAADGQVLVPALTGLVRLLLEGPGRDITLARTLADEAQRVAPSWLTATALAGAGWVRLAEGDLPAAREAAAGSIRAARAERRTDHLAEGLELAAAVSEDPAATHALLQEAESIWRQAGAVPAADRLVIALGRRPGARGEERLSAKAAERRLLLLGVMSVDTDTAEPTEVVSAPVRVQVMGGFEVLVGGRPVPFSAWRSKQARTLIKLLVARRGHPVPRAELCELLWPDSDSTRTAHRLSVLLSVVRGVLDPQHVWPVDQYLRADSLGVSLNRAHIAVDAEGLLRDAAHARRLIGEGDRSAARQILVDVDQHYRGGVFEEEPAEIWAGGLREEVRAVWLRCLRELADLSRAEGDLGQAATLLTRVLSEDPYDESAHHRLVRVMARAGRHGEARRALDRWTEAMREIGAPPPDPEVLGLTVRSGPSVPT